jgi:hypothetical protein
MQHVRARGEVHIGFWWGDPRKGEHLEDRGVDGMIILKLILKKWDGGMDCIDMAQDRDKWRDLFFKKKSTFAYNFLNHSTCFGGHPPSSACI